VNLTGVVQMAGFTHMATQ